MRVARKAARMRTSAGASEVATTTTDRARPWAPRTRSTNSATSLPRSPTRAMTETSAAVPLVIMDMSEDLPTPEPAKIPRRWPRPQGTSPSRTRTPSSSCSEIRPRRSGWGGVPSMPVSSSPTSGGPSSIGRPSPSRTRPSSSSPTLTGSGPRVSSTRAPTPRPVVSP